MLLKFGGNNSIQPINIKKLFVFFFNLKYSLIIFLISNFGFCSAHTANCFASSFQLSFSFSSFLFLPKGICPLICSWKVAKSAERSKKLAPNRKVQLGNSRRKAKSMPAGILGYWHTNERMNGTKTDAQWNAAEQSDGNDHGAEQGEAENCGEIEHCKQWQSLYKISQSVDLSHQK
jgi:hypothetical protein